MKKILKYGKQMTAFLLAVILTATLLPTEYLNNIIPAKLPWMVKAAEIVHSGTDGDLEWSIDSEGCLRISGSGDYNSHAWTVYSDEIKTAVVDVENITKTDYMFYECSNLSSIEISNSITTIGQYAFYFCYSLRSIEIPDSVTRIGFKAFYNCRSITSVEIPDSVTSIGDCAFSFCSSLRSIEIPDSVTSIGNSAFENCLSLSSIEIPDSVTSIDFDSFSSCSSLRSIEIPDSVTSIGDNAFSDCKSLSNIKIPDSVTSIGYKAFSGCESLSNIEIPDSVTSIGSRAFYNCSSLSRIKIPDSVTSINNNTFSGCSNLSLIEIPDSVTSVDESAFDNCDKVSIFCSSTSAVAKTTPILQSLCITEKNISGIAGDNLTYYFDKETITLKFSGSGKIYSDFNFIGKRSAINVDISEWNIKEISGLREFKSLKNLIIPDSVTSIGDNAFENCLSLSSVEIPNSVINIGDDAFSGCESLSNIEIPDSVTSIGNNAFSGCKSLSNIEIPDSVTSIGNNAFSSCSSLSRIKIPDSVTSINNNTFSGCSNLSLIEIPDSVTSIGMEVFRYCSSLSRIEIPDSVTSIGSRAFYDCSSLSRIKIPNSVMKIYKETFNNCSSLTSIEIPASVTDIMEYAFSGCANLKDAYILGNETNLESGAFSARGTTTITIHGYMNAEKYVMDTNVSYIKYANLCDEGIHHIVNDDAVSATCTEPGKTEGKHCSECNEVIVAQKEISAFGEHTWDNGKVNGDKIIYTCIVCKKTKSKEIHAEDTESETLIPNNKTSEVDNNTVTNKKTVASTLPTGNCSTKVSIKKATIKAITTGKKKLTVKAKKKANSLGGTVYQIAYKQKGTKKWIFTKSTTSSKAINKLKTGKRYYVKIRAYKTVEKKAYYGAWSATKLSKKIK